MNKNIMNEVQNLVTRHGKGTLKIAIHKLPYVTKDGHACHAWHRRAIVVGPNPLGPRGGHGGDFVDGKRVGAVRSFNDRGEIEKMVKEISEMFQIPVV